MYNTSPSRKRNRQFSTSEKLDAIQRVRSGESKAAVARYIDVPESTLRGWCKKEDKLRYNAVKLAGNGFIRTVTTPDSASNFVTKTNLGAIPRSNAESRNYIGAFGPNTNEVTFNPNLIAQLNNQASLAISPKSTEFPRNGFIPQSNFTTKQNNDQALDMIHNLKKPLTATVNRSPTGDQQFFDRKNIYLAVQQAMQARSFPPVAVSSQQQSQTMKPPLMLTTPPPPPQRTTSSAIPQDNNGNSFLMWQKYNQSLIDMMGEKSQRSSENMNRNVNGHASQPNMTQTEYSIRSLSVSSSSSSKSPIPDQSEDVDEKRVVLDDIFNNNSVVANNDPNVIGVPEAVAYAEKFFKWFETYSDPTITSQDFMHFEKLLCKVRNIAERGNKPVASSTKIRSRK